MDAITETGPSPAPAASAPADFTPALPPESRLEMPEQKLFRFDPATERRKFVNRARTPWLSRIVTFGGGLALTGWGAYEMYRVIDVGGISFLKWVLLFLFLANFSWIALSFAASVVGFLHLLFVRPKPPGPAGQARGARRRRHADLQRGALARVRRAAGHLRGCRGHRPWRRLRLVLPVRHHRSRHLDRRGARLCRLARPARAAGADLLPPPREKHRAQGRQYRGFRHPLGRRL